MTKKPKVIIDKNARGMDDIYYDTHTPRGASKKQIIKKPLLKKSTPVKVIKRVLIKKK